MKRFLNFLSTSKTRHLYHFTDDRNLQSIAEHGLLSLRELRRRKIAVAAFGGNAASHQIDERIGMDQFVHLCLFDQHPMEYVAKQQGRIGETTFLKIKPAILDLDGVMFTDRVANDGDSVPRPLAEIDEVLDLDVIYSYADWKDPEVRERLNRAKKYEILIPTHVPMEFLGK